MNKNQKHPKKKTLPGCFYEYKTEKDN